MIFPSLSWSNFAHPEKQRGYNQKYLLSTLSLSVKKRQTYCLALRLTTSKSSFSPGLVIHIKRKNFIQTWKQYSLKSSYTYSHTPSSSVACASPNLSKGMSDTISSKQEMRTLLAIDSTIDHIDQVWHHCLVLFIQKSLGVKPSSAEVGFELSFNELTPQKRIEQRYHNVKPSSIKTTTQSLVPLLLLLFT